MLSFDHDTSASYSRVRSRRVSPPSVSHGSQKSAAASSIRLRPVQQTSSESRGPRTPHYPELVSPNDIMMYSVDNSVGKASRGSPPEHLQVKQSVAYSSFGKVDDLDGNSQYPASSSFPLGPYDETSTIRTDFDPRTTEMRTNERQGAALNKHRFSYQQGSLMDSHWYGAASPGGRQTRSDSPQPANISPIQLHYEEKVDSARQRRPFKPSRHHPKQNRHKYTSPCAGGNQVLGESGGAIAQRLQETRKHLQGLAISCTNIRMEHNCMDRQKTNAKDGRISFGHQYESVCGSWELRSSDDNDDDGNTLIGPPKIKNIWRDNTASCGFRELISPCGGLYTHFDDRAERINMRRPRGKYDSADTVLADRLDDDSGSNRDRSIQHVTAVTDIREGASPSSTSNYVTSCHERTLLFQDNGVPIDYPQASEEFLSQDQSTQLFQVESNPTQGGLEKTESEHQESQLSIHCREPSSHHSQHAMVNNCIAIGSEEHFRHEKKITIGQTAKVSPVDINRLCNDLHESKRSSFPSLFHDNRGESELQNSPFPSENASPFLRCPDIDVVVDEEILKFSSDIVSVLRAEVLELQANWAEACAERLASEKEKGRAEIEKEKARKEAFDLKDHVYHLAAAVDLLREQQVRNAQQSEEEAHNFKRELGEIRQLISTTW